MKDPHRLPNEIVQCRIGASDIRIVLNNGTVVSLSSNGSGGRTSSLHISFSNLDLSEENIAVFGQSANCLSVRYSPNKESL